MIYLVVFTTLGYRMLNKKELKGGNFIGWNLKPISDLILTYDQ